MNISVKLSRIIRFTLAIIASMVAGFWIGSTVDDDYMATTLALVSIVVIAAVILNVLPAPRSGSPHGTGQERRAARTSGVHGVNNDHLPSTDTNREIHLPDSETTSSCARFHLIESRRPRVTSLSYRPHKGGSARSAIGNDRHEDIQAAVLPTSTGYEHR